VRKNKDTGAEKWWEKNKRKQDNHTWIKTLKPTKLKRGKRANIKEGTGSSHPISVARKTWG